MSERAPIATEPTSVRIQASLSEPLGEIDSSPARKLVSRHVDGWGLAIETALSPKSDPLPFSSPPLNTLAEAAGQQKDVHLWRSLARACEEKGQYSEALVYVTEAIRMQPDDVASLSLLAQLGEKQHADEAAAHWHRQVLMHDPARKTSNRFLAHYYYCRGTYEKAVPYFTQLLAAEPQSRLYTLYYLLARVKTSDFCGVANLLAEVQGWQQISSEERALAHELFSLIGSQSLKNYHVLFATRYLTWAQELIPTPEGATLLAKAIALSAAVMEDEDPETSAHVPEPATLEAEHRALSCDPEPHTFLRLIMTTVGVVALAVALGFPLFFARPYSFLPWQKERFVLSEDTSPQRFSDSMPVAPESVPADRIRQLSPSSGALPPQAEPVISPPDSDTRVKVAAASNRPIEVKPESLASSPFSKSELPPKLKSVIRERLQRPEKTKREQKTILSAPLITPNGPPIVASSTAQNNSESKEQKTEISLTAVAPQPNQPEEPTNQFAVASAPQHEAEVQESPLPVNDVASKSADSLPPVELAAVGAPLLVKQGEHGKTEEAIGMPLLPSPVEETTSVIAVLSSQLPYAKQFPTREREVALSPEQLWPQLKALVEQETEVLLREDKEQGVLHGTIIPRQLRPRIHTFKPYGHYLLEVNPGTRVGTSLIRVKILAFDWRTKRPVPDAEKLADRFLRRLEERVA